MKLELKHWSAYLPFGLKVKIDTTRWYEKREPFIAKLIGIFDFETLTVKYIDEYSTTYSSNTDDFTPILRPLSDLDTQRLIDDLHGKMSDAIFDWIDYFNSDSANKNVSILCAPYPVIEWCFENHIDIFGLIEQKLAIDINTLNK